MLNNPNIMGKNTSKHLSTDFKGVSSISSGIMVCNAPLAIASLVLIGMTLVLTYLANNIAAYAAKAPKTKRMQAIIQADNAVIVSVFGDVIVMLLKMLIKTRNNVTNRVILPGTISGGMRKLDCKEIFVLWNYLD